MSLSYLFSRSYWDPFRSGYYPSCLYDQDFGLPSYPEQPLRDWMEWVENCLSTNRSGKSCSVPAENTTPSHLSSTLSQQLARGTSVVQRNMDSWKISLDVKHFTPAELQVKAQEGYLEISGNHKEREDQHGFISRTFTRKYKLPSGVDVRSVTSTLTSNGILIVDAPLPSPVEVVIPVQTEEQLEDEKKAEKEKGPEEEEEQLKRQDREKEMEQAREAEGEKGTSTEQGKEKKEQEETEEEQDKGKEEKREREEEKVVLEEREKK